MGSSLRHRLAWYLFKLATWVACGRAATLRVSNVCGESYEVPAIQVPDSWAKWRWFR